MMKKIIAASMMSSFLIVLPAFALPKNETSYVKHLTKKEAQKAAIPAQPATPAMPSAEVVPAKPAIPATPAKKEMKKEKKNFLKKMMSKKNKGQK